MPEVGDSFYSKILCPNGINSGCFKLHISYNVVKFMASLTSLLCSDSLPAIFLSRQDGAIYRLPEYSQMSDRLKNEASVKADYFRLWNTHKPSVYYWICRVAVKSEHWNCMQGKHLLVNPVTYCDMMLFLNSYSKHGDIIIKYVITQWYNIICIYHIIELSI